MTALTIVLVFGGYTTGILIITVSEMFIATLGVIPLSMSMIAAWYLSHEAAHQLVLRGKRLNNAVGESLSLINGGFYFPFKDYRTDHLRHHAENVDLLGVDMNVLLGDKRSLFRRIALRLEYFYIPICHDLIRLDAVVDAVRGNGKARLRIVLSFAFDVVFIALLAVVSWFSLIPYLLARCAKIHCVRFVDAFQHSYPQLSPLSRHAASGVAFEQANTFSFPVARKFKFLNWLILNFGYHNAHHAAPACPWYHLPELNRILFEHDAAQDALREKWNVMGTVSVVELALAYHRGRVRRITEGSAGEPISNGKDFSIAHFGGAFTDNLLG
ncbi:fatty acid desaturase [Achromobacter seleniivolatilans]|uniref:Fatty acid desaturase n=1 Tax=Achromobacter seleniivolatilans TaxID=3047478 RepID=A0ABY9LU62_9BURK|nr:fatty acid desaturase [Achromobacter sp. R39]WMD18321.1 fatty acid desaturase [Achromobacter sp. R39]